MISSGHFSGTLDDIYRVTTQTQIASYYLGIKHIPCLICSPLRIDKKPSMGIYSPDGNNVNFIDFSTNERGSILTLLRKLWNSSFADTLKRIYEDFTKFSTGISIKTSVPSYGIIKNSDYNRSIDIQCKIREWRDYDIRYWESYGVPLKWLKYADVYPISHKIVIKNNNRYIFRAAKYAYAFVEFKEGKVTIKIYQPYEGKYKWTNKHDKSVISLWTKVPEYGERICICSSLKDALCLWANTNIPSIAIQGEGYSISNTAISELKRRYKRIYILLDNDDAGVQNALKLSESTGFTNIVLPKFEGGKDISDLIKVKGKNEFLKIVLPLFNN